MYEVGRRAYASANDLLQEARELRITERDEGRRMELDKIIDKIIDKITQVSCSIDIQLAD